jgi:hypothetical protein
MAGKEDIGRKGGMASGLMLASAVVLLALPSAVLAFSSRFDADFGTNSSSSASAFPSAQTSPTLTGAIPVRSLAQGQLFRFTPARTATRPDRSVTVAVRIDPESAKAISVHGGGTGHALETGSTPAGIAPAAFNLGVSRGYQNFIQSLAQPGDIRKIDMPDLSKLSARSPAQPGTSRFNPHIVVDEKQAAGRAPRTFSGDGEDQVDLGGSYRVTRNLDVTAGVRYSQERERLRPVTDGKQDSQAVYVGTQFRF